MGSILLSSGHHLGGDRAEEVHLWNWQTVGMKAMNQVRFSLVVMVVMLFVASSTSLAQAPKPAAFAVGDKVKVNMLGGTHDAVVTEVTRTGWYKVKFTYRDRDMT